MVGLCVQDESLQEQFAKLFALLGGKFLFHVLLFDLPKIEKSFLFLQIISGKFLFPSYFSHET